MHICVHVQCLTAEVREELRKVVLGVCVGSVFTRPHTGPGHLSAFTSSYFPLLSFTREHLASGLLHLLFLMLESLFVLAFTAVTPTLEDLMQ